MSKVQKPVYELGTILVIKTWDGKHTNCYFFNLTKRRASGNYIGRQYHPTEMILKEFTTCEGYKYELILPEKAKGNYVNLTWQRKSQCFSHLPAVVGTIGSVENEIYDPMKHYYNEA